jgi:hypothetical protein
MWLVLCGLLQLFEAALILFKKSLCFQSNRRRTCILARERLPPLLVQYFQEKVDHAAFSKACLYSADSLSKS